MFSQCFYQVVRVVISYDYRFPQDKIMTNFPLFMPQMLTSVLTTITTVTPDRTV